MSAIASPLLETPGAWSLPDRGKVAMASLIIAESAIFTIFVVAYLFYIGKSLTGPTPRRRAGDTDLLHHLSAVQQSHDSLRRQSFSNAASAAYFWPCGRSPSSWADCSCSAPPRNGTG